MTEQEPGHADPQAETPQREAKHAWIEAGLFGNEFVAHTVALAIILVASYALEHLVLQLYGDPGLVVDLGENYHLQGKVLLSIFDAWNITLWMAHGAIKGFTRWVWRPLKGPRR